MGVPGKGGREVPPLVGAGDQAGSYPGSDVILFHATVENSGCATDLVPLIWCSCPSLKVFCF